MITEYFKTCGRGDSITAEALLKRRWGQSVRDWGLEAVGGGFGDFRRSREWVSLKRSRSQDFGLLRTHREVVPV